MAIRIGINGFGRIGRLVCRIALEHPEIEVVAVNDLVPADNLAYLLKYDTMHGRLLVGGKAAEVTATENSFTINGRTTKTMAEKDPAKLPWKDLGVHYVLESTGLFTEFEKAQLHINGGGAKRVLLSAPTKSEPGQVPTMCYKVNHEKYDPAKHTVVSNASCTTNCLAPIAKVIQDNFGLEEGLMTTIHAVTATQPTQDGPSKKDWRGGRNAYMNIIPASTGAGEGRGPVHPRAQGQVDRHVLPRPHRRRLRGRPHLQDRQGHLARGDQRGDEAGRRRLHGGRAGLHGRGSRLQRLRQRPAQLDIRRQGRHPAQQPLLQGCELVRQRGRLLGAAASTCSRCSPSATGSSKTIDQYRSLTHAGPRRRAFFLRARPV